METPRATRPWLNYLLGAACAGAILAAILVVGPASGSQSAVTRTAKAAEGVVQSTVSGSGNLQAASQLNLGFKTSGTVTNIYMTQGRHVTQGQLLATLDPQSAEVTLEQAKASLQSAEANLAKEEETNGETTSAGQSSGAGPATPATPRPPRCHRHPPPPPPQRPARHPPPRRANTQLPPPRFANPKKRNPAHPRP